MPEKPPIKQLNSIKEHKLTRRRILEAATAAGMSTAAAMALSPDDVKAADSDQVTVPFDVHGNSKFQIASDTLDWYYRARDATERITNRHQHKDGVATVGTRGGGKKDNPHVIVRLENENGKADERRGEIPEEQNGVRVEVEEYDNITYELHDCDANHVPEDKNFPGGQQISPQNKVNAGGTNTPRFYKDDYSWFGWTTAAHVLDQCGIGQTIQHNVDLYKMYDIGVVTHIDERRDIAFIKNDYQPTSPMNLKPSDHGEGVEILGTISEEAFLEVDSGEPIFAYGIGSCFSDFVLKEWNQSTDLSTCDFSHRDQMVLDAEDSNETEKGDSGMLYFVEDPNNPGDYYAMGSHTGSEYRKDDWGLRYLADVGPQGFTIYDIYDKAWRQ